MSAAEMDELLAELAQSRAELERAVAAVPEDARGRRPSPERWSVAEVIEHLALVEGWVARLLEVGAAALAPDAAPEPVPRLEASSVVDRSRRIDTVDRARPTRGLAWEQAWAELAEGRRALLHVIRSAPPDTLARMRAPHRIFGVLDGPGWVRFVAGHEARHAAQIDEIHAALAG